MDIEFMPLFERMLFLLKRKGLQYTCNYIYFKVLWGKRTAFLSKILHLFESYPAYIEIEVTTRCNLRCVMCEHTYWAEPNRDMTFEQFTGIVDQFPKLKWIGLTGIGESFLHKDFLKMLRYVKERNIMVELFDTFFFIDAKTSRELLELEIDTFLISFDAATKETYEKIRVGSDFDRVVNNLRTFIRLRSGMKTPFPHIEFHFTVTRHNHHEMLQYIDFVNSLCMEDKFRIRFTRMLHSYEHTKDMFVEIPEETIREVEKKAGEIGIPVDWNADVCPDESRKSFCECVEWTMPFIFVTGDVVPCCAANEAGQRDYQRATALGNIFENSFKDIWNGDKYRELRAKLRDGTAPEPCVKCPLYVFRKARSAR